MHLLASAQSRDTTGDLGLVIACIFILAAAALLAAPPIAIARRRNHRFAELLTTASLLWGVLAAGSAITTLLAQSKFQAEYQSRMMSGNFDVNDYSGQPPYPWLLWAALMAAYVVLITFSLRGRKSIPPKA